MGAIVRAEELVMNDDIPDEPRPSSQVFHDLQVSGYYNERNVDNV